MLWGGVPCCRAGERTSRAGGCLALHQPAAGWWEPAYPSRQWRPPRCGSTAYPPKRSRPPCTSVGCWRPPGGGFSAIIVQDDDDDGGELVEMRGERHSPERESSSRRGRGGAFVGLRGPPKTASITRSNDSSEGGNPPGVRVIPHVLDAGGVPREKRDLRIATRSSTLDPEP